MQKKDRKEIYEELKGFFPAEYDLDPDELENESVDIPKAAADIVVSNSVVTPDLSVFNAPETETLAENEEFSDTAKVDTTAGNETKNSLHDIFDIIEMFAVCTACIIVLFSFFARLTIVDGSSMCDTLTNGEYLVISDFMYDATAGDIVVLQDTTADIKELQKPLIKRIIATGGQSVDISPDGIVTITDTDGTQSILEESYIKNEPYEGRYYGHWEVPEGHIFVMGDNRNGSTDSRDFRLGVIDERCIVGKALLRVLPFNNFWVVENPLK